MAKLSGVQTVDMVNGEITKVSYNGAVYTKVDGFGKPSDVLLRVKDNIHGEVTVGNYYECVPKGHTNSSTWYITESGRRVHGNSSNFVVFRNLNAKPTPAPEALEAKVDSLDKRLTALEAKTFEDFPKGARVRLLSGGGIQPLFGKTNGEIYTVVNNDVKRTTGRHINIGGAFALPDQLELLSAEEHVFAKLGRKLNEYKAGDIVRVTKDNALGSRNMAGDIGVVESVRDETNIYVQVEVRDVRGASGNNHGHESIELIAPVESRADVA